MGKFVVKMGSPKIGQRGIETKDILFVLSSLPGTTYVISMNEHFPISIPSEFDMEAENDLLEDGTVVSIKYKLLVAPTPFSLLANCIVFDGFDIIPPTAKSASNSNSISGSPSASSGSGSGYSSSRVPCNHSWTTYYGLTSKYDYCSICGDRKDP